MAKRKCKFTEKMKANHPCFRNEWESECLVCKTGSYISSSCKGIADLKSHLGFDKHCKAVREASSSNKMTNYFVTTGCKTEDKVTAAEGS